MIRAIGGGLIIITCSALGFRIAKTYRDRPRELTDIASAIRMLRAEIEFNLTPLPEALRRIADRTNPPLQSTFEMASERLTRGDSVQEAFDDSVDYLRTHSALSKEDVEALKDFTKTLGTSDLLHQTQQLDNAISRIQSLESDARALQQKNERLWQYLGLLLGLLIVIVLY